MLERDPARTVFVDMDGVLANFDAEVERRLKLKHPHIPINASRTNFYISEDYEEHKELVRAISDSPSFFASLEVVDGALEGWQRIKDAGFWPRICSSPIRSNPTSTAEKLAWLERHFVPEFGKIVVKQAIIASDKTPYHGIALVDDRPAITGAETASWQHIVFDQPYNVHIDTDLRLRGWHDPDLESVLLTAQQRYIFKQA